MIHLYVNKMRCGIVATMTVDDQKMSLVLTCKPVLPWPPQVMDAFYQEYVPWRNEIMSELVIRTGKKITLLTFI